MVEFTTEEIEQIINYLQGTCKSIDDAIYDIFGEDRDINDLSAGDYASIDERIFLCNTCGWWYEQGEMAENDNWECEGCADD